MTVQPELLDTQHVHVRLEALDKGESQTTHELSGTVVVFGSGDSCDRILTSDKVDAAQTAIVLLGNTAYLCDLGAPGGTSLNGRRIRWERLADGDEICIGTFRYRIEMSEVPGTATGEQPVFKLCGGETVGDITSIDPVLVVGSDPGCDVVLYDEAVARRHCLVVWTQDGPVLRSLVGDENLELNGRRVGHGRLVSGDTIQVGSCELVFEIETGVLSRRGWAGGGVAPDEILLGESRSMRASELVAGALMSPSLPDLETLWGGSVAESDDEAVEDIRLSASESVREGDLAGMQSEAEAGEDYEATEADNANQPPDPSAVSGRMDEGVARIRERVAAAQQALDERARRHWEQLDQERVRLESLQVELKKKAATLLNATRQQERSDRSHRLSNGLDDLDRALAASEETESMVTPDTLEGHPLNVGGDEGVVRPVRMSSRWALQDKAAELAELVRRERDKIDLTESRFETLRLSIERLRDFVSRTEREYEQRAGGLESHVQKLRQNEIELRQKRESLFSQIRQLDGEAASLRVQMEETGQYRDDLERSAERLTEAREKVLEKEEALRSGLELERQRIQIRQAELQRKAADLAKSARDKRRLIEAEVSQRQAMLDQREAEIDASRAAIKDAGRTELQKTVTELERVLGVRLANLEAEISGQTTDSELGSQLLSVGNDESGTAGTSSRKSVANWLKSADDHGKRLASLRDEVQALRGAMDEIGSQQAGRRTSDPKLASRLARKASGLRMGQEELQGDSGACETETVSAGSKQEETRGGEA
ncbi:MAG: FHA domain-containing protein [Planctomycetota bacterium]